jgi:hypothetical protein
MKATSILQSEKLIGLNRSSGSKPLVRREERKALAPGHVSANTLPFQHDIDDNPDEYKTPHIRYLALTLVAGFFIALLIYMAALTLLYLLY